MQGIPAGFALTAIANYLIGRQLSAVQIGSFDALIGLPWIFQFIWGPLIDRYQFSLMGHRKHWIIGSQLLALGTSIALLWITDPVNQAGKIAWIFFIHSTFASIQDASVDAAAIALFPDKEKGKANAFMRSGLLLGGAGGAAGLSLLLHNYGFYTAALCQFMLLAIMTLLTYVIKVDRVDSYIPSFGSKKSNDHNPKLKWLVGQLYKGIVHRDSLSVFGFIALVYLCLSIFIRSFSFQLIHYLHWPDSDLSLLQGTWGSVLTIIVTLGGGIVADRIGASKLQLYVSVSIGLFFVIFNGFSALWIHHGFSTAGILIYSLADPIFSVAAMPVLMALCYKKVEGSQFTAYMAIVNLCDVLGAYLSGWGMSITTAPVIGMVCGLMICFTLTCKLMLKRIFA